jgi:hypothetical protein
MSLLFVFTLNWLVGPIFAAPASTCVERALRAAIKRDGSPEVKVADQYFRDVQTDSVKTCFKATRGDVFDVITAHQAQGYMMVKIRDGKSGLFWWMNQEQLKLITGKRAKIADTYFKDIHQDSFERCLSLTKGKAYQASEVLGTGAGLRVEIRDSESDMYQTLPIDRVTVIDPTIVKACPDLPRRATGGSGAKSTR